MAHAPEDPFECPPIELFVVDDEYVGLAQGGGSAWRRGARRA